MSQSQNNISCHHIQLTRTASGWFRANSGRMGQVRQRVVSILLHGFPHGVGRRIEGASRGSLGSFRAALSAARIGLEQFPANGDRDLGFHGLLK